MRFLVFGLLCLFFAAQINLSTRQRFENPANMVFPLKEAATVASGEFTDLASDYYLFTSAVLYSSEERKGRVKKSWAVEALKLAAYLDPYYQEVYWMAGSLLPWDGYADPALEILEKAPRYLPDNWRNLMSLGILYYMFQNDNEKAAEYFSEAAQKPGAPKYLKFLASRLYYKANKLGLAILFLRNQLDTCTDKTLCEKIEKRLICLESIDYLNKKVQEYVALFGYYPEKIEDLEIAGLVTFPLPEPYGGKYYLTKEKKVWTTSNMR